MIHLAQYSLVGLATSPDVLLRLTFRDPNITCLKYNACNHQPKFLEVNTVGVNWEWESTFSLNHNLLGTF